MNPSPRQLRTWGRRRQLPFYILPDYGRPLLVVATQMSLHLAEIGEQINAGKSNWRLLMLDEPGREEFRREAVAFAGLAEIMDMYPLRVSASRRIPDTKFLGRPPRGMNATGVSDEKNYQTLSGNCAEAEDAPNVHVLGSLGPSCRSERSA